MIDDALDSRTVQELRVYADGVIRPIDAMTIAETAIARGTRRRVSRTTLVFLAAALILALVAVAVGVGTRPSIMPLTTYRGVLVAAPDLLVPRRQPLVVPLADGRVLIAGGDAATTTTAEVFDPATGRAEHPGAMVSADNLVLSSSVLLRDGRVLLVGDAEPADAPSFAGAQVFDPATMSFADAGPMVTPRAQAKLALLRDGRVVVAGGTPPTDINTTLATAELFDPATGAFSATGSMASTRVYHSMTTLADGRVLVTGGDNVDTAEIYDPATGSFAPAGSAPQIKGLNLPVLLADGRVVLIGQRNGSIGDGHVANGPATAFDPVTGTFTELTTVPTSPGTATLLGDGRIFLTGWWSAWGGNWSGIYDPASGKVTETGPVRGWAPSAARLADGRVLVVGGLEDGKLHGEGGHDAPPVSSMQILE